MPSKPSRPSASRPSTVQLNAKPLTPDLVEAAARHNVPVRLHADAARNIRASRSALESVLNDGLPHYGINTGFGSFSRQRIARTDLEDLQRNLIRSHAAGVGPALPREVVRGMMLLLAASLGRGHSGVRPQTVQLIIDCLNADITPVVPETGSVGASGDLAPLAHVALVLIGEGEALVGNRRLSGALALKSSNLQPLTLQAKEGLALINGTHLMAASASLLITDFDRLFNAAIIAFGMSLDACRGTDAFLDARVHTARNQPGQTAVATKLRAVLEGSRIIPSHVANDPRVQDPYSLRCTPQVLGAAFDAAEFVRSAIHAELGAVTDNPLIFAGKKTPDIVSAGNFHGMPIALPLDVLAISIAHVAGIAERRVYHMLGGFDAEAGLTPYLSPKPGLHSGLMIAQYTAAACCNELIGLANPASVANLSTSAGQEDYNSFGPRSAAKARRGVELARSVIAIELLCAAEGVERHRPLKSGHVVERAIATIRTKVPALTADRPPAPDIAAIDSLISHDAFADRTLQKLA